MTVSCIVTNVHSSINPSLSFPPSSPDTLLPRLPPESPAASAAEDLPSSIPPLALAADKRLRGLNSKAFRSRISDFYHLQRERGVKKSVGGKGGGPDRGQRAVSAVVNSGKLFNAPNELLYFLYSVDS